MSRLCDWCGKGVVAVVLEVTRPLLGFPPETIHVARLCSDCEESVYALRAELHNPSSAECCARCGDPIDPGDSLVLLGGKRNEVYHTLCVR